MWNWMHKISIECLRNQVSCACEIRWLWLARSTWLRGQWMRLNNCAVRFYQLHWFICWKLTRTMHKTHDNFDIIKWIFDFLQRCMWFHPPVVNWNIYEKVFDERMLQFLWVSLQRTIRNPFDEIIEESSVDWCKRGHKKNRSMRLQSESLEVVHKNTSWKITKKYTCLSHWSVDAIATITCLDNMCIDYFHMLQLGPPFHSS